jgi:hypothetical protein
MMPGKRNQEQSAFELLEEALHLLRLAPIQILAFYYLGALPFVLGLLYYCADMSRSAMAEKHHAEAAFGVALLFVWMKLLQAVFAIKLRAYFARGPAPGWSAGKLCRIAAVQALLQASGFLALPVALCAVLPAAWTYAFYQNASALSADCEGGLAELFRRAKAQSMLWPFQNHILITILFVFNIFVVLNLFSLFFLLPFALKTFLGVETAFTQSPWSLFNTTTLAVVCGLTYLCVDPLAKAAYVLRCFYGEALRSGADLEAEFKALAEMEA